MKARQEKILNDAIELEKAGAFAIVLEKIPAELAKKVTESVKIPTIGIGAGPHCDGQVLVVYDMLGLFEEFKPKFVRRYAELAKIIKNAFENYISDVKTGKFPAEGEFY
jgi:3-methyl-2-oxobutanoate hydroxymethyltransferase